jgi:putative peptide zinc metalloprotease protein
VKKPRMYASLAIVAAVLLLVLFLPLPYHVHCSLEVQPRDAQQVYVMVPGELEALHVERGQKVESGTPLADLRNLDLELEIAQLQTQRDQYQAQLTHLQQARYDDDKAAAQIPGVKDSLAAIDEQLEDKKLDLTRLHLVAHRAGVVIPPMSVPPRPSTDGKLPTWHGTPLEKRNLGALLPASTWFCQIGDPDKFDAILVVDQSDIELVREGQNVKIMLDELPGQTFHSPITAISNNPIETPPNQLSNKRGGSLETRTDPSGVERTVNISYSAKAPLDDPDGMLLTGLKGQAKIDADYHSLGWRLWRFLQHTFHFKL